MAYLSLAKQLASLLTFFALPLLFYDTGHSADDDWREMQHQRLRT